MITPTGRPKKDPESVRRRLLSSTVTLMSERGFAGVSVSEIASGAGVTKGGLFHHFSNKQQLIAAVFDDELEQLSVQIEKFLLLDSAGYGRFTRAYIRAIFLACSDMKSASALTFSLCTAPELVLRWDSWMTQQLELHRDTDSAPELEVVRFAADGLWFTNLLKGAQPISSERLYVLEHRLLEMTTINTAARGHQMNRERHC